MTNFNKYHVLVVGCGQWGKNIVRDLLNSGCWVSCVDTNADSLALAEQIGAKGYSNLQDVAAPDGVVIATPATQHLESVRSVSHFDVPIFCEKPLTTDLESAKEIVRLMPGKLFVMHNWRYHPGVLELAAIAREKQLGNVQALKSIRANWTSPRTDTDSIWTLVPHDLTLALSIFGHIPEPKTARIEYLGERAVGMTALLGDSPWFSFESSNRYAEKLRQVRLHCDGGVAILQSGEATELTILRGTDPQPVVERRSIDSTSALLREIRRFVGYLAGGPAPETTAEEGLLIVEQVTKLRELSNRPQQL
ncbi:MAG: putative dehydrogenase [Parasphingorhabdus sp.]|jgi:predicted dehydrogenase